MTPTDLGTRLARVQRAFSAIATLLSALSRLVALLMKRLK